MIMLMSEQKLIMDAKAGNLDAFEGLMCVYQPMVYRLVLSLSHNTDDAEDAMQETMLRAFRSIRAFRGESSFKTWLCRIAINTSRNWIRKESRASASRFAEFVPAFLPDTSDQPDKVVAASEEKKILSEALLSLPDHYREVVVLRHYQDLSYQDISDILKVPVGTVKSRLAQARYILARKLDPIMRPDLR